jgi:hypothetical protein
VPLHAAPALAVSLKLSRVITVEARRPKMFVWGVVGTPALSWSTMGWATHSATLAAAADRLEGPCYATFICARARLSSG